MKRPPLDPDEIPRVMAESAVWIGRVTGLAIHENDQKKFLAGIEGRMRETGCADFSTYIERINGDVRFSRSEAEILTAALTPAETYFLRDRGQLRVIEEQLLPQLCQRRQDEKRLRLWSAGCASGEEAWSLSIILALCSAIEADWEVTVLGTDINRAALEKARRGEYGEWSFRQVSPEFRQHFFRPLAASLWAVNTTRLRPVRFFFFNLLSDALPDPTLGLHSMDIIVCRNVFIYFAPEAIQQVVTRLIECLRPGGFLVTGHGELSHCRLSGVKHTFFADSSVYEKLDVSAAKLSHPVSPLKPIPVALAPAPPLKVMPAVVTAIPAPVKPVLHRVSVAEQQRLARPIEKMPQPEYFAQASQRRLQGFPDEALKLLARQSEAARASTPSLLLAAHCEADLGRNEQARRLCSSALKTDPLLSGAHYLLAQMGLAEGDFDGAREALRATLYIAPEHPLAQLDLAALAEREGDSLRAERLRQQVVEQLLRLPPGQIVLDGEVSAAELLAQIHPSSLQGEAKKAR